MGAIQPTEPPEVAALLRSLEVIPPQMVDRVPVMDVEAILNRRPGVCLVDGLAYDNPPGSKNQKRWEDVQVLLDAGISVITSINLIYIEEQRERVEQITGNVYLRPFRRSSFRRRMKSCWWTRHLSCVSITACWIRPN